jgi:competence CoiA-like predicted nuclease
VLSCKVGKSIVYSFDKSKKETLRKWLNKGILKCPICNGQMIFKAGELIQWHFAHKSKCTYNGLYSEPETDEHLLGKKTLFIWFKKQPNIKSVELEKWIPEIKLRPDLFVVDNLGRGYCIEYQCSPTTMEKKKFKSELYKSMGYKPIWIFGTERISKNSKLVDLYRMDITKKIFFKKHYRHNIKKRTNFYFENGEFFVNKEINEEFNELLRLFLHKCKLEDEERYKKLKGKQCEIYNEMMKIFEEERKRNAANT